MMNSLSSVLAGAGPAVGDHLWQSTAFAGLVWVVAWMLRRNPARVRYGLWLVASGKFLVPFSVLVWLGSHLAWSHRATAGEVYVALDTVSRPFAGAVDVPVSLEMHSAAPHAWPPVLLAAVWGCGSLAVLVFWWVQWRRIAGVMRRAEPLLEGREVAALRGVERAAGVLGPIAVLASRESMEPGVFGLVRPALLWPEGISQRLDDAQLEAVLAHEVCHVRRRDNLTSLLHMVVEALFWFHPLVWWMEGRLVEERERACDEEVLRLGMQPVSYAESILKVCEFCVETPLACVSGITGADLKKRIVRIMALRVAKNLTPLRRLMLGAVALGSLIVPVWFGVVHAASIQDDHSATDGKRLKFAVVSIRQNKAGGPQIFGRPTPDGYAMKNMFLAAPIFTAYVPQTGGASHYSDEHVLGLPSWTVSDSDVDRYDISAKVDEADIADWQNPSKQTGMLRAMLQSMLADRLKLVVHRSMKEEPVYLLIVGKNGPKFKESNPAEPHPGAWPFPGGGMMSEERKDGEITSHFFGISIGQIASSLSRGRTVQDRTGLTGKYDITWQQPAPSPPSADGQQQSPESEVSPFSLAEQIGLKLESSRGQVETLVIDHIERPSEN